MTQERKVALKDAHRILFSISGQLWRICDRLHEVAGGSIYLPKEWRKEPNIWTIWNRWPFTFTYKSGIALSLDEAADMLGMSDGELVEQLYLAALRPTESREAIVMERDEALGIVEQLAQEKEELKLELQRLREQLWRKESEVPF